MNFKALLATASLVILSGCMSPVVMVDPSTGNIAQCFASGPFPLIARHQCVEGYENLGWKETTPAEAQQIHQQRVADREDQVRAAIETCRAARQRSEMNYAGSVRCSNPQIRAANVAAGYDAMDLLDLELAARLAFAEKIDRGQMTEAEANLKLAEFHSEMVDKARSRRLEAQASQNQTDVAKAAQVQATGALLQGAGAYNASTQPRGFSCTTVGTAIGATTRCY
jgi:hypothetical protein